MVFADKAQRMREAARVLKPGGRFVFNVWDRLERNVLSQAVHEAVAQVFPHDPPRFLDVPFSWHDLSRIVRDLQAAGFGRIDVTVQPRASTAPDARHVALGLVAGSPLANQVIERGSPGLEDAAAAVAASLSSRFGSGPISAPMQAFQIAGHLPAYLAVRASALCRRRAGAAGGRSVFEAERHLDSNVPTFPGSVAAAKS